MLHLEQILNKITKQRIHPFFLCSSRSRLSARKLIFRRKLSRMTVGPMLHRQRPSFAEKHCKLAPKCHHTLHMKLIVFMVGWGAKKRITSNGTLKNRPKLKANETHGRNIPFMLFDLASELLSPCRHCVMPVALNVFAQLKTFAHT